MASSCPPAAATCICPTNSVKRCAKRRSSAGEVNAEAGAEAAPEAGADVSAEAGEDGDPATGEGRDGEP
ncbi:hypothetical protein GCM10023159_00970 [Brevibacterium yomogidense]